MYKLSVPINIHTIDEENIGSWIEILRRCEVQRVFVCFGGYVCDDSLDVYKNPEKLKWAIDIFRENDFEVAFWLNTLGHGGILAHEQEKDKQTVEYTQMAGVMGEISEPAYCPLDEKFSGKFCHALKFFASMNPDIIMLDDDFRLNLRSYYLGCFCELHLAKFYERIGEVIPREKLEELIFTGGKNKYRTEFMRLSAETLLDFSKKLRTAVDEVNPKIRLGACTCHDNWDFCGTDALEIARALAGNTEPFIRTIGAPYWHNDIIPVIENTRLQIKWCEQADIEVFTEGDVYPRPRYNVPARVLELFDIVLYAEGRGNGILKYMFPYDSKLGYETGYYERHIKNLDVKKQIRGLFEGKRAVGVYPYKVMHVLENAVMPEKRPEKIANKLINAYMSGSENILSRNSIPVTYSENGSYPVLLCGESARYIDVKELENGAILDVVAAKILSERGIDTGLISIEQENFSSECFVDGNDEVFNISNGAQYKVTCSAGAEVKSFFMPGNSPSSYRYENSAGQRFFVLSHDLYLSDDNINYTNNYCRQNDLVSACEWLCGRKLPAISLKNPKLYILAAENDGKMAVLLLNISLDEIPVPEIFLDKKYSHIKFVNCNGRLEGDKVVLSEICPYGFAAFEVE